MPRGEVSVSNGPPQYNNVRYILLVGRGIKILCEVFVGDRISTYHHLACHSILNITTINSKLVVAVIPDHPKGITV